MVKKKNKKKIGKPKLKKSIKKEVKENISPEINVKEIKEIPKKQDTKKIASEHEIARDFALKVYREFDQMIKSIVLFGSAAKNKSGTNSDIDIIIIVDDASIGWDLELISWYREELSKIIKDNPYIRPLHINTVKLTTWWSDLMRGDPVIINVLRYGEVLIDYGGFFNPLKILLKQGKIKATPESMQILLERSGKHLLNSKQSLLTAVDALYWSMVDSAHALLIAKKIQPASPEDIGNILVKEFVSTKNLNKKHVNNYDDIRKLAKEINHGELTSIKGSEVDEMYEVAYEFTEEMARLVKETLEHDNH